MCCTSALLKGVYGRGLISGVTGSSPAPTSSCDRLSILSTSALYGSGLNTGVPGASHAHASLCGVPPPPPPQLPGEYSDEPSVSLPKLTGELAVPSG